MEMNTNSQMQTTPLHTREGQGGGSSLFDITGHVVVITGGTGVLGRAIAKYLAAEGAKVAILGRKAEVGEAIAADITAAGGEAIFLKTNVLDKACLEQNLADILARYGRVDALLNAAGGNMPGATIAPDKTFFDLDPAQFQTVLDLNLTGTVIPTQVFLRPMVDAGKGVIVNFSSMAAFRPMTRVCGYAAAKAGLIGLTKALAKELGPSGVRVNCLCPGVIDTEMNALAPGFFITEQNRALLTNPDGSYTQRGQDVIRQTPFGRMGQAEELCGTIHYLISDASRFVTGTVAVVDGGFNAFAM